MLKRSSSMMHALVSVAEVILSKIVSQPVEGAESPRPIYACGILAGKSVEFSISSFSST